MLHDIRAYLGFRNHQFLKTNTAKFQHQDTRGLADSWIRIPVQKPGVHLQKSRGMDLGCVTGIFLVQKNNTSELGNDGEVKTWNPPWMGTPTLPWIIPNIQSKCPLVQLELFLLVLSLVPREKTLAPTWLHSSVRELRRTCHVFSPIGFSELD